jgi:tRNA-specific adenosine deaminase 2
MNATNRTYNGTRHAEFIAINDILTQTISTPSEPKEKIFNPEVLNECDLYVTVEPCIMCASLLRQFGIRKVYFGASNEKFGGTGGVLNIHTANGKLSDGTPGLGWEEGDYEVSGGWLREEAIVLLRRFYVQENGRGELFPTVFDGLDSDFT